MNFQKAARLRIGDEIALKKTGALIRVVDIRVDWHIRAVYITTNEGRVLHHTQVI